MAWLNLNMVKLLIIFVYLIPGYYKTNGRCLRGAIKGTCPAGWSKWTNHCYKVTDEALEWVHAKDKCIEIGGVMATPNTLEEQSHLLSLASTIWIDCNDIDLINLSVSTYYQILCRFSMRTDTVSATDTSSL